MFVCVYRSVSDSIYWYRYRQMKGKKQTEACVVCALYFMCAAT